MSALEFPKPVQGILLVHFLTTKTDGPVCRSLGSGDWESLMKASLTLQSSSGRGSQSTEFRRHGRSKQASNLGQRV